MSLLCGRSVTLMVAFFAAANIPIEIQNMFKGKAGKTTSDKPVDQ